MANQVDVQIIVVDFSIVPQFEDKLKEVAACVKAGYELIDVSTPHVSVTGESYSKTHGKLVYIFRNVTAGY